MEKNSTDNQLTPQPPLTTNMSHIVYVDFKASGN